MDFRNFCRKIDMDGIRAKLPTMPIINTPGLTLSQIKMPKLKSRKIFRSSREDINVKRDTVRSAPPTISPSEFINHTPQRISTISSLMNHSSGGRDCVMDKSRGTYRSAYSIDDDYPIATTSEHFERRLSKPISPVRSPPHRPNNNEMPPESGSNTNMSLMDKLQKGYKDISEFRFKHIFAKKTVVRKDIIQVDNYVVKYNEDRMREQQEEERRNRDIADNYRFKFKTSRQRSGHSNSLTSNESVGNINSRKKVCHESGDESGMEESPPKRAPPVEPRRAARVRKAALTQNSLTDDDQSPINGSPLIESKPNLRRGRTFSANRDESDTEDHIENIERTNAVSTKTKSSTLTSIKGNIQRFQKSIKRSHSVEKANESGEDVKKTPKVSTTEKIAARLRKFKSQENIENESTNKSREGMQPVQVITTKLKTWKKSFKKQTTESAHQTEDETSPDKQTNSNKLMKKLKDIRSRKQPDSEEHEEDNNAEITVKKASTLEDRFTQARQRTLKKMQQISFFHKSQDNIDRDTEMKTHSNVDGHIINKEVNQRHTSSSRQSSQDDYEYEYEQEEIEEIIQRHEYSGMPKTMWSTNPILSDSIESDIDCEFPRVVIHQDHSDAYESTLIIAVTRSAMSTPLPSPKLKEINESEFKITEIPLEHSEHIENESKNAESTELMPNKERLLQITPPSIIKVLTPQQRSIDTAKDIDVWIPNTKNITSSKEDAEPWKVHSKYKENLYKTRSMDLFEKNVIRGGLSTAFEDFDDELKNAPIVRIAPCNMDSFENESEDLDETDDEGSLKSTTHKKFKSHTSNISPTKYLKQHSNANRIPQIGNSRESLITNVDRYEDESEDDMNRPPSTAPSPPPQEKLLRSRTTSPSPPHIVAPKLPQNQPPKIPERILSPPPTNIEAPPLPISIPPEIPLPRVPERTTSINRISKPLVKTSSLRLTFDEQVNPSDVGKVNKLITRFEQPRQRPRILSRLSRNESTDFSDDEDNNELTIYESNEDGNLPNKEDIDNGNALEKDKSNTPTPAIYTTQKSQGFLATNKPNTKSGTQIVKDNMSNNSALINLSSNDRCQANFEQTTYINIPKISLISDRNSNYSCASSEYGSPPEYPSSLMGSTHTTPVNDRKQQLDTLSVRRGRRSMTRDDEHFFSFDSDEENSYYSISSTGSSRYVVEL